MPIHDQGYRRYQGRRDQRSGAWWVIARSGVLERLRERRMIVLLLVAWVPFVGRAVQIYTATNFRQAAFLAPTAVTFRDFFQQQGIFVFFVTILVGAGLIATDRRANALPIYFSRPLTRVDYVTGKLVVLALFLAAITWVPGILLLALQPVLSGDTQFVRENLFLFPAITLVAAIQILLSAFPMLALSSLSRSRRFVAIVYAGVAFFSASLAQALGTITGSTSWAWLSPQDMLSVIADAIFRVPGQSALSLPIAILVVAVLIVVSMAVLRWRVRSVEVVT